MPDQPLGLIKLFLLFGILIWAGDYFIIKIKGAKNWFE